MHSRSTVASRRRSTKGNAGVQQILPDAVCYWRTRLSSVARLGDASPLLEGIWLQIGLFAICYLHRCKKKKKKKEKKEKKKALESQKANSVLRTSPCSLPPVFKREPECFPCGVCKNICDLCIFVWRAPCVDGKILGG